MSEFVSDWYIVPSHIRKLQGMTLAYLDVFETIFQFLNKNMDCFLTNEAIEKRTTHSKRTVQRALEFFERHRELKRIQVGARYYFIKPPKRIEAEIQATPQAKPSSTNHKTIATQMTRGGDIPVAIGVTAVTPINKEDKKGIINNNSKGVAVDKLLIEKAKKIGIPEIQITEIIKEHEVDKIQAQLVAMEKKNGIANPVGYLRSALKNDYVTTKQPAISVMNPASWDVWSEDKYKQECKSREVLADPEDWRDKMIQEKIGSLDN